MKRLIILFTIIILSFPVFAQLEVKEGSFREVPGFVNINVDKMYDDNDKPYAVLKIKTENISSKQRRELNFGGDAQTFFEVEYKDGEVWLYISYYASFIKISHEEFSSTEFYFPFDMKPKCGYEMTVVNKSSINEDILKRLEELEKANSQVAIVNNVTPEPTINSSYSTDKALYKKAFSVGPNKVVDFSKGNLQYQASTKTWRFAEHQWDVIGETNKKISRKNKLWIDLFGWGTGCDPTQQSTRTKKYSVFNDWGNNSISNGDGKKWRTLTKEEWEYLLYTRKTSSGIRYLNAIVGDVVGVILLPDNYMGDTTVNNDRISQSDWINNFEVKGAVFLPSAGARFKWPLKYIAGSIDYWSATSYDEKDAYFVGFDDSLTHVWRVLGLSVRLVCDVED